MSLGLSRFIAVLLCNGLRREEVCSLKVADLHQRQGVPHLSVLGKGGKRRFIPAHHIALAYIDDYLREAGHGENPDFPLFRPVQNNVTGTLAKHLNP